MTFNNDGTKPMTLKQVGADQGYVIPTDDASTLGTSDTHLNVHLKNGV